MEKQGRTKTQKEIDSKEKNREDKQKRKKNKRVGSEVRKQKCDKAYTNRLLPSLPFNSLLSSQLRDLIISYLGPFFQSGQFLWQDFLMRLPTLEIGSLLGLKSAKELSPAD